MVLLEADPPDALHVAGHCAESQAIQHVDDCLVVRIRGNRRGCTEAAVTRVPFHDGARTMARVQAAIRSAGRDLFREFECMGWPFAAAASLNI